MSDSRIWATIAVLYAVLFTVDGKDCKPCGKSCCTADEHCDESQNGGICYKPEDVVFCNAVAYCVKPMSCCGVMYCCAENYHCCSAMNCCPVGTRCHNTFFCIRESSNSSGSDSSSSSGSGSSSNVDSESTPRYGTHIDFETDSDARSDFGFDLDYDSIFGRRSGSGSTSKPDSNSGTTRRYESQYSSGAFTWILIYIVIGFTILISVSVAIIYINRRSRARPGVVVARPIVTMGSRVAVTAFWNGTATTTFIASSPGTVPGPETAQSRAETPSAEPQPSGAVGPV